MSTPHTLPAIRSPSVFWSEAAENVSRRLPAAVLLPFPDAEDYLTDELRRRFDYKGKIDRLGCLMCIYDESSLEAWLGGFDMPRLHTTGGATQPPTAAADEGRHPYWASTMMVRPQITHFSSIKEAASILRALGRNWASCPAILFRRTALIQDALPHINTKPKSFPTVLPATPMGLFTLLDETTMLYSAQTTSCLPCGRLTFVEDHVNPPSRAYLKLQEALTMATALLGARLPDSSSVCFDAGASPGGWTWVLSSLGCRVLAVDRAPLAPQFQSATTSMGNSRVAFMAHDAFTIEPEAACASSIRAFGALTNRVGNAQNGYDWVCSDVACYPERLLPWIKRWVTSGLAVNMVCTIKLKRPGEIDYGLISQFSAIPHSRVLHLNANKHELTWLYNSIASSPPPMSGGGE